MFAFNTNAHKLYHGISVNNAGEDAHVPGLGRLFVSVQVWCR